MGYHAERCGLAGKGNQEVPNIWQEVKCLTFNLSYHRIKDHRASQVTLIYRKKYI